MAGLTDAAKAEIAAAIKIVREDKVHSYIRRSTAGGTPPPTPPPTPPVPPVPGGPLPPPPKPPEPTVPPVKPRSAYWGEILSD
jgi:hypothetical protein